MRTYTPDFWKVIRITYKGETFCKIFATWGGSYLYGSSWKLSSGGNDFNKTEDEDTLLSPQFSGSTYEIRKGSEGICGMWGDVYSDFIDQMRNGGAIVEEVSEEQIWSMAK